jgi:hypothetical protein
MMRTGQVVWMIEDLLGAMRCFLELTSSPRVHENNLQSLDLAQKQV